MSIHPWNQTLWNKLINQGQRSTHAWLFSGPRGLGKQQFALQYARQLIVAQDDAQGHNWFQAGTHPDFHLVASESQLSEDSGLIYLYAQRYWEERNKRTKPRTVISIEQIRQLIVAMSTRPHSGECKVALIIGAENMNINAANGLLKLLEEPTQDSVLICVSDHPYRLPATIRSRCTVNSFGVPSRTSALTWLEQQMNDGKDLELALDMANGAPLEAKSLVEQNLIERRNEWMDSFDALVNDKANVAAVAEQWKQIGVTESLELLQRWLIDLMRYLVMNNPQRLFNTDRYEQLRSQARSLSPEPVFEMINLVGRQLQQIDGPLDINLLLEDILIQTQVAISGERSLYGS